MALPRQSTSPALPERLLQQLTFYGSYHHNIYNQIIHIIFVPAIVWGVLVWAAYSGPLPYAPDVRGPLQWLPSLLQDAAVLNVAALIVAGYSIVYTSMEAFAGLSWVLVLGVPLWLSATAFEQQVSHAWAWAAGVQALGWFMQIVPGHAHFEKRKPALMDSLWQAVATAPLFVWFEVLFALGYRPVLYAELQRRVLAAIAQFRKGGAGKEQQQQQQEAKQPLLASS